MKRASGTFGALAVLLGTMLLAGRAAALMDANKCEAAKNKIAGKYYFCREKAEAKALTTGSTPDYSKCTAKFDEKWDSAESNGGGMCPDNVMTAPMNAFIAGQAAETAAVIAGAQPPACGDNAINVAGEACDGTDLNGETCVSLGFAGGTLTCSSCAFDLSGCGGCTAISALPASGQTTGYGAGSDGAVQAGATLSYTDNGDGTITDNVTGLMWEKKSDDGSIHDKDNTYKWGMNTTPYTMNGTMVTTFLAALNGGAGFAGHTDWRIPNVKELQSIVNYEIPYPGPAVSAAFNTGCVAGCSVTACSCTGSNSFHWSSTSHQTNPEGSWIIDFRVGDVTSGADKSTNDLYVRAVRGDS